MNPEAIQFGSNSCDTFFQRSQCFAYRKCRVVTQRESAGQHRAQFPAVRLWRRSQHLQFAKAKSRSLVQIGVQRAKVGPRSDNRAIDLPTPTVRRDYPGMGSAFDGRIEMKLDTVLLVEPLGKLDNYLSRVDAQFGWTP